METKLTLRLDEMLIRQAKAHAEKSGKSVSRLVADFFTAIEPDASTAGMTGAAAVPLEIRALPPITRSLLGIIPEHLVIDDKLEYRTHLDEKYR